MLTGPPGLCTRAWHRWAGGHGWTAATVPSTEPGTLLRGWAAKLAPEDLASAFDWLARATGEPSEGAAEQVRRMTRYDLDRAWRSLEADTTTPAAAAARAVMSRVVAGAPVDGRGVVEDLAAALPGAAAVVRALCELVSPARWPTLLVSRPVDGPPDPAWLSASLAALEPIAAAVPRLPVAVAAAEFEFDALTSGPGASRVQALAREGHVPVRSVSGPELVARLARAGVPAPHAGTLRRLTADGLSEEAADAYVAAATAVRQVPADADDATARSAAERFLFEQLDAIPTTAGLFRLNRPLDFDHGHRAAEADLLAAELRLVIEVDGRYYHLTPEQYRSDRRKDWLYQRHGYLVLRFLAEDVVEDLEATVATVGEAVAFRCPVSPA